MSLASSELAVVSLGCSCQTSHQLRHHCSDVASTTGLSGLEIESSYFDFVITPIDTVIAFMFDFPELRYAEELQIAHGDPVWRPMNLAFVHNYRENGRLEGPIDIEGSFEQYKQKTSYLRQKFLWLAARHDKITFVLSNTQSNIMNHVDAGGDFISNFGFSPSRIAKLREALFHRFGRAFSGLVVVEDDRSWSGVWKLDYVHRLHVGSPARTWHGDYTRWQEALTRHFAAAAPVRRQPAREASATVGAGESAARALEVIPA